MEGPFRQGWPFSLEDRRRGAPRALPHDEPLAAIDEARRGDILGLIETLRDAFAIPIVFVSHRSSEVERLRATSP
jgi:molybdate transport system ATP-binding protein